MFLVNLVMLFDVSNALGLSALKSRSWSIFKTSEIKGEGLDEAMDW